MKVETNNIGNYSLGKLQNNSAKIGKAKTDDLITSDERRFFIDKYPQNKDEIVDYHFYKKNGGMSGVKVGSLFDKRG